MKIQKSDTPMKKRSYRLTLIEVVIALALTGLIISYLWQSFFNSQKQQASIGIIKEGTLKKIYFQEKMSQLFISLNPEAPLFTPDSNKTEGIVLVLNALHPIDLDPDFSGAHKCVIKLLEDKKLCLIHLGENKKIRSEILFNDVNHIEIFFFHAEEKTWTNTWDKTDKTIPCMIKFIISSKDREEYIFFPSQHIKPITYRIKGVP
ncbi:MAG: hypothetical protein NT065_04575 [Chlamydiae bacterium]|nr:hypothetical protein [Chlamydiota bacterium]